MINLYIGVRIGFFDTLYVKIDGKLDQHSYKSYERNTYVGNPLAEWYNIPMSDEMFKILNKVANNKNIKIRLAGKDGYVDRVLTYNEVVAIKKVLDIYKLLNNVTVVRSE